MYRKGFAKTYIVREAEVLLGTSPCMCSAADRELTPSTAWPKTYLNEFLAFNKPALSNQLFIQEVMGHPNTLKKSTQPERNGDVLFNLKNPGKSQTRLLQTPK